MPLLRKGEVAPDPFELALDRNAPAISGVIDGKVSRVVIGSDFVSDCGAESLTASEALSDLVGIGFSDVFTLNASGDPSLVRVDSPNFILENGAGKRGWFVPDLDASGSNLSAILQDGSDGYAFTATDDLW